MAELMLPVYVRVGGRSEYRIGEITIDDPDARIPTATFFRHVASEIDGRPSGSCGTHPGVLGYYDPDCGFCWHGSTNLDVPTTGELPEPVCPRCELARVTAELARLKGTVVYAALQARDRGHQRRTLPKGVPNRQVTDRALYLLDWLHDNPQWPQNYAVLRRAVENMVAARPIEACDALAAAIETTDDEADRG